MTPTELDELSALEKDATIERLGPLLLENQSHMGGWFGRRARKILGISEWASVGRPKKDQG